MNYFKADDRILEKLFKERGKIEVYDGLDDAYREGFDLVLNELENNFDGGITESYLAGMKKAIQIYEAE